MLVSLFRGCCVGFSSGKHPCADIINRTPSILRRTRHFLPSAQKLRLFIILMVLHAPTAPILFIYGNIRYFGTSLHGASSKNTLRAAKRVLRQQKRGSLRKYEQIVKNIPSTQVERILVYQRTRRWYLYTYV